MTNADEYHTEKCPHPNCESVLRFKREVTGECLCVCHGCVVVVSWEQDKPIVMLAKKP